MTPMPPLDTPLVVGIHLTFSASHYHTISWGVNVGRISAPSSTEPREWGNAPAVAASGNSSEFPGSIIDTLLTPLTELHILHLFIPLHVLLPGRCYETIALTSSLRLRRTGVPPGEYLSFVRTSHITLSKQDEVVADNHGRISL